MRSLGAVSRRDQERASCSSDGLLEDKRRDSKRPVHEAITSVENHPEHMRFARSLRLGLPIGSGAVEATCKTRVGVRMKHEARWLALEDRHRRVHPPLARPRAQRPMGAGDAQASRNPTLRSEGGRVIGLLNSGSTPLRTCLRHSGDPADSPTRLRGYESRPPDLPVVSPGGTRVQCR